MSEDVAVMHLLQAILCTPLAYKRLTVITRHFDLSGFIKISMKLLRWLMLLTTMSRMAAALACTKNSKLSPLTVAMIPITAPVMARA